MGIQESRHAQHEVWMTELLARAPGLRDSMLRQLRDDQFAGNTAAAVEVATLLLLHSLADFADFRGLAQVLAAFDAAPPNSLRAAAVKLGRPLLDHRYAFDDPALLPAREQVLHALRAGSGVPADERVLLAKVLLDHDGLREPDAKTLERLLALMQDAAQQASPRWQASWWRIRAECLQYIGHTTAAQAATQQLQRLAATSDDPELLLSLACEDMRLAVPIDDRQRAERAYRTIEQLRPLVRPALLPRGLRAQVSLLLRRGEFGEALARMQLTLQLCEDHEVPLRDRAGYIEQQAHALSGLRRHAEAVVLLESLRATQSAGQAEVLEIIIAMARAVQAMDEAWPDSKTVVLAAIRRAAAIGFHNFLMSFPGWAAQVADIGLAAGVEVEFLTHAIRERRLVPAEPTGCSATRADWPWALHVRVLGGLRVLRSGVPIGSGGGKGQKKPLELLVLLAAHPAGLSTETLIDALWPSLEADAPRASLEMAVSRLRKWLDCPDAVRVADGRVALHLQQVWSDVAAFEQAAQRGDVEAVLSLYEGPLLQGERLTGLAQAAREQLGHRLAAVVLQQMAQLRAQNRSAEYLALLGRALAADPGQISLRSALLMPPD